MGHAWPGRIDGQHHVAHGRQKASDVAQIFGTYTFQTPAPLEVNEGKIAELQNRIQDLQHKQQVALNQQNKFFGAIQSESQTAAPAQVAGTTQPAATGHRFPSDSRRAEEKSVRLTIFVERRFELQEGPGTARIGPERCLPHEQSVRLAGSATAKN